MKGGRNNAIQKLGQGTASTGCGRNFCWKWIWKGTTSQGERILSWNHRREPEFADCRRAPREGIWEGHASTRRWRSLSWNHREGASSQAAEDYPARLFCRPPSEKSNRFLAARECSGLRSSPL